MNNTITINTNFLARLEEFLMNNPNIGYKRIQFSSKSTKDCVEIFVSSNIECQYKEYYIKQFINFLRNGKEPLDYYFRLHLIQNDNYNNSILKEFLTLNPTEKDLLLLYSTTMVKIEEFPILLNLLTTKSSYMEFIKISHNIVYFLHKSKDFLEMCFHKGQHFKLNKEDYIDILIGYIHNAKSIKDKDDLFNICLEYIDNDKLLEQLIQKIYGEKVNLNNGLNKRTVEKLEINRLHLIKNYKLISEEDLDKILIIFVKGIIQHISLLKNTYFIQYFKSSNDNCHLGFSNPFIYNLLLETNDIHEVTCLLHLYLKLLVSFNTTSEFIEYIKNKPQVFEHLILQKKLADKVCIIEKDKHIVKKI